MSVCGRAVRFGSHDLVNRVRFLGVVKLILRMWFVVVSSILVLVCSPNIRGRKMNREAFGVLLLLSLILKFLFYSLGSYHFMINAMCSDILITLHFSLTKFFDFLVVYYQNLLVVLDSGSGDRVWPWFWFFLDFF